MKFAIVAGTRPEIIKLAPVYEALRRCGEVLFIATGQHDEMAHQALRVFGIRPDVDLKLMRARQTPLAFFGSALSQLEAVLSSKRPDWVIVQGDTMSTLAGALAGHYQRVAVAHVEAGLRSYNRQHPFPEETNRILVSDVSNIHFCPTAQAKANLAAEGITQNVHVVGNTIVDALSRVSAGLDDGSISVAPPLQTLIETLKINGVTAKKKLVLVTGHRRESFSGALHNLCQALLLSVRRATDVEVVFPVHLNPTVQEQVRSVLQSQARIHLMPPLDYPSTVYLMKCAALIVTDSGGIQEEAPSLGVPVLVTRKVTERQEGLDAGLAELMDLSSAEAAADILVDRLSRPRRTGPGSHNPYGDGNASERIARLLSAGPISL